VNKRDGSAFIVPLFLADKMSERRLDMNDLL